MFFKHRHGNHGCGNKRHGQNNCCSSQNSANINDINSQYILADVTIPLNTAPINSMVEISTVIGCPHINHRLAELGLSTGSRITIIQSSGTGPVIVLTKGSRIALGQGMSEKILVRTLTKNTSNDAITSKFT